MALRTQPASSLPQRSGLFAQRRLRWSVRVSRRLAFYWLLTCVLLALSGTFVTMQLPTTAARSAFGLQSDTTYLTEWLGTNAAGSYATLQLLKREANATQVFAFRDGARHYSNVPISNPWTAGSRIYAGSEEEILAGLEAGGYSHILLDRAGWWGDEWSWDQIAVINEEFPQAQHHTRGR